MLTSCGAATTNAASGGAPTANATSCGVATSQLTSCAHQAARVPQPTPGAATANAARLHMRGGCAIHGAPIEAVMPPVGSPGLRDIRRDPRTAGDLDGLSRSVPPPPPHADGRSMCDPSPITNLITNGQLEPVRTTRRQTNSTRGIVLTQGAPLRRRTRFIDGGAGVCRSERYSDALRPDPVTSGTARSRPPPHLQGKSPAGAACPGARAPSPRYGAPPVARRPVGGRTVGGHPPAGERRAQDQRASVLEDLAAPDCVAIVAAGSGCGSTEMPARLRVTRPPPGRRGYKLPPPTAPPPDAWQVGRGSGGQFHPTRRPRSHEHHGRRALYHRAPEAPPSTTTTGAAGRTGDGPRTRNTADRQLDQSGLHHRWGNVEHRLGLPVCAGACGGPSFQIFVVNAGGSPGSTPAVTSTAAPVQR